MPLRAVAERKFLRRMTPPLLECSSEANSGTELQFAGRICHGAENPEAGGIDVRAGRREVDRVVDVERVRLEGNPHSLMNLEFPPHAQVDVRVVGREKNVWGGTRRITHRVRR